MANAALLLDSAASLLPLQLSVLVLHSKDFVQKPIFFLAAAVYYILNCAVGLVRLAIDLVHYLATTVRMDMSTVFCSYSGYLLQSYGARKKTTTFILQALEFAGVFPTANAA
jgi:hypothetical protein